MIEEVKLEGKAFDYDLLVEYWHIYIYMIIPRNQFNLDSIHSDYYLLMQTVYIYLQKVKQALRRVWLWIAK